MEGAGQGSPNELRSRDGRVLASIEPDHIAIANTALVRSRPGADPDLIASALTAGFSGWQITVDDERVAAALVDRGEVLVRHAHLMTLDVGDADVATSVAAASCSIGPLEKSPDRYAHLLAGAYPVGHVDHDPAELLPGGARHTIATYLSGEVVGSVRWDASCEARDGDDVIGFIVVSMAASGRVFPGGPWVTDIAVDPRFQGRGVGAALLFHAIDALARAGDEQIGLAVSHGNRARGLYDRSGFVEIFESWRFMIAGS